MNVIDVVSLVLRLFAFGLAVRIAIHHRDGRIWLFTVLIGLLALRPFDEVLNAMESSAKVFTVDTRLSDIVKILVSVLIIPSVFLIGQLLDERKRHHESLRAGEERLRACIENTPNVAVQWYDADGRVVMWNPASERMFGFSAADAMGKRLSELIHTEEEERAFCETLLEIERTGRSIGPSEFYFRRRDGSKGVCLSTVFQIPGIRDRSMFVCMDVDLSDRIQIESELKIKESQLRLFVEHAPAAVAMLDRQMRYLVVSRRWHQDYHLGDMEIVGRSHYEVFPEMPDRWKEIHRRCLGGAVEKCDEDIFPRADGSIDWVRWEVRPWYDASGEIGGIVMFTEVITDRMKATEALRQSEERFRGIADYGSVGIWQITMDHRSVYANQAMCGLLEIEGPWVVDGQDISEFFSPSDREKIKREMALRQTGQSSTYELELIGRRGTRRQVLICGVPLRSASGVVQGSIGTFTDITALKNAELAAMESRERFAGIVQSAMDGIITIDESHRIVLFNSAAESMFQCSAPDVLGQPIEQLIPHRFRPSHAKHVQLFHETGTTNRRMGALGAVSGLRAGGEEFPIEASISQMDAAGRHYYTVILRDVSDRQRHEKELRESQEMLERAQEVGRIGSWWSDVDFHGRLKWSKESYRIFGFQPEEFDERVDTFFELVHPEDRAMVRAASEAAIRGEKRYSVDHRIIRRDGTVAWVHEEADIVRDSEGHPLQMIGVTQEITKRRQADNLEAIRTLMLEGLTRGILLEEILNGVTRMIEQASPGVLCSILLLDPDGRHLRLGAAPSLPDFYNEAIEGIEIGESVGSCGTAAFTGKPVIVADISTHPYWAPFAELARRADVACCWSIPIIVSGGTVAGTFAVYRRTPGEPSDMDMELIRTAAHFVAVAIERKRAEEAVALAKQALLDQKQREKEQVEAELSRLRDELVHKTRLATIGQVSASIAHELRNPLGAVRNAAFFLKRRAGNTDEKLVQYLTIIEQEVASSDRIISNLMEMTRSTVPGKQQVNLGEVLELVESKGAGARIRYNLKPEPFYIHADPDQIRQVLANLHINATQSMQPGGEIHVDAHHGDDYDVIVFRDEGEGVPVDHRGRLFEPLFTTKAKGTGLGLTICRQIVERHGGGIELLDDGTGGAAFRIRLPRGPGPTSESDS